MTRWLLARSCMVPHNGDFPTDLRCPVSGRICIPSAAEVLLISLVPDT